MPQGAWRAAYGARQDREAKRGVDACRDRLAEAEAKLALRESDLEEANDRNRHLAIHRIVGEVVMQSAVASMMGPMYTLARAVSPYLQVDETFEASLSPQQADDLARRFEIFVLAVRHRSQK